MKSSKYTKKISFKIPATLKIHSNKLNWSFEKKFLLCFSIRSGSKISPQKNKNVQKSQPVQPVTPSSSIRGGTEKYNITVPNLNPVNGGTVPQDPPN